MELLTALSSVVSTPPPRLMLATAGLTAWAVTQSMPAATCAVLPLPWQLSTRTPTSCTPLATPYDAPPTVPETCVPWPLQSSAVPPSISSTPRPGPDRDCPILLEPLRASGPGGHAVNLGVFLGLYPDLVVRAGGGCAQRRRPGLLWRVDAGGGARLRGVRGVRGGQLAAGPRRSGGLRAVLADRRGRGEAGRAASLYPGAGGWSCSLRCCWR